ncbi:MAG: hypothetical protein M0Q42_03080 [Xanthomonadales bacterium]|nr:hypothetical protein [Xanthomonadales bacterium]
MTDTLTITLDDEQARAAFVALVNRASDLPGLGSPARAGMVPGPFRAGRGRKLPWGCA